MSRIRNVDILLEMIDLTGEIISEVRQQLTYFRASVYKDETAHYVRSKIERLQFVVDLFSDELMLEPFMDYEAEIQNALMNYVPGECSFTARVTRLLESLEKLISKKKQIATKHMKKGATDDSFAMRIRMQKSELMSICRHGSRQWAFFQRI